MPYSCNKKQRQCQRGYTSGAPEVYAFETLLHDHHSGERIHAVKVGKCGRWSVRLSNYKRRHLGQASRFELVDPGWDSMIHVPVNGMAEASVAEALTSMILKRVLKLETPKNLREYYLGVDLSMVAAVLNSAAASANVTVAQFLQLGIV